MRVKDYFVALIFVLAALQTSALMAGENRDLIAQKRTMSQEMEEALNVQLKSELDSAYLYMGISAYFDSMNLDGFAKWFRVQAEEELGHAMRVYTFLNDRGANVNFPTLQAPSVSFESPLEAFEASLAREQELTMQLQKLYALTQQKSEYDAGVFVQWFLSEQVEEEQLFSGITGKLKFGKDNSLTILMMDKELGSRKPGADA